MGPEHSFPVSSSTAVKAEDLDLIDTPPACLPGWFHIDDETDLPIEFPTLTDPALADAPEGQDQ